MMRLVGVLFCLFSVVFCQHDHREHGNHEQHRVNVGIYYESLCPDSRKFITDQLYPSLLGNLSEFVNLTLVPYGKSTTQQDAQVQQQKFTCHHGPAECHGNKIQACAIRLINNGQNNEGLGYNKVTLGFITCLMEKTVRNGDNATFPTTKCATDNNVPNLVEIENCADHTDGSNYLSDLGAKTDMIQKPLKSVPTIVLNNKYKEEDVKLAQTNFVKALCQYIPTGKPAECFKSSAKSLVSLGGLYLIVLSFVVKISV